MKTILGVVLFVFLVPLLLATLAAAVTIEPVTAKATMALLFVFLLVLGVVGGRILFFSQRPYLETLSRAQVHSQEFMDCALAYFASRALLLRMSALFMIGLAILLNVVPLGGEVSFGWWYHVCVVLFPVGTAYRIYRQERLVSEAIAAFPPFPELQPRDVLVLCALRPLDDVAQLVSRRIEEAAPP